PCCRVHRSRRHAPRASCHYSAPRSRCLVRVSVAFRHLLPRPAAFTRPLWHTCLMARGWESKDVESQMEAGTGKAKVEKKEKTPQDLARQQERRGLQLSRTRVANELEAATHPNHRKSLEAALAHLDQKISELS